MNNRKTLIAQSFDRSVENYDDHTVIQKQAAHRLMTLVPDIEPQSILEIGCGTGYLTKIIKDRYPNSDITAVDISKNMIACCQSNIDNICFEVADGEIYETDKKFDLIISNMTIQWFDDVKSGLDHLKNLLKPDGLLVFSGLGRDSFYEWNQVNNKSGFIEGSNQVDIKLEDRTKIQYKSGLDFLKSIKIIGAGQPVSSHKKSSVKELKKSCKLLEEQYDATVTWHIIYGCIKN